MHFKGKTCYMWFLILYALWASTGILETYPIDSRAYYVLPIQELIYTVEQENKTLTLTKTSYTVLKFPNRSTHRGNSVPYKPMFLPENELSSPATGLRPAISLLIEVSRLIIPIYILSRLAQEQESARPLPGWWSAKPFSCCFPPHTVCIWVRDKQHSKFQNFPQSLASV